MNRAAQQRILERADKMISSAHQLLETVRQPSPGDFSAPWVDEKPFAQWRAQCLSLLTRTEGAGIYLSSFEKAVKNAEEHEVERGLGILKGFREDVADGELATIRDLVSAEVFSDLLEQARHLLSQGYASPAAGLVGAVLERELRVLCGSKSIKVKSGDGIAALNQKLVSATPQVYNAITSKKIALWAKIRNDADHGHFENVKADDVSEMIEGVETLLERLLGT